MLAWYLAQCLEAIAVLVFGFVRSVLSTWDHARKNKPLERAPDQ